MTTLNAQTKHAKILISACLLGERVRYDAKIKKLENSLIDQWFAQGLLLAICPEVGGGLATPRPASEIQEDHAVQTQQGQDFTLAFQKGAQKTLQLALNNNIKIAILTEKSPSCGSHQIYNGQFTGTLMTGEGITTQLLRAHGIQVFNQFELAKVAAIINDDALKNFEVLTLR